MTSRLPAGTTKSRWHPLTLSGSLGLVVLVAAVSCDAPTSTPGPLPAVEAVVGEQGQGDAQFVLPRAVAFDDRTGHLCVVDRSGRIQRFQDLEHPASKTEAARARREAAIERGYPGREGWQLINFWTLPEYDIGYPTRLRFDGEGRLLVADTHYHRVRLYQPETGALLESRGETGEGEGQFSQVRDVVRDAAGNYYVGDYGGSSDRILKFSPEFELLATIGRRGSGPVEFQRIQALEIHRLAGGRETLLVADSCNHRIQRLSLDGELLQQWGEEGAGESQFRYPFGIAVEPREEGDIYVVEWGNNRLQRFSARGEFLGMLGEAGRERGQMATPWDVELAADGRLFIADCNNHRVQIFRWPGTGRSGPTG